MVLLNRLGLLAALATLMLVAACGRSDPLPCKDNCGSAGDTRCLGDLIQTCTQVDPRCHRWQDTTDCAQYNRVCQENDHGAACVKACSNACIPEGVSRCNGDVVQTCAHDERGCLSWTGVTDCADFGETCEEMDGRAHCAVTCNDECTDLGATMCGGSHVLTCASDFYGCLYWEYTRDCADSGLVCKLVDGAATCTPCIPDCVGRQCGPDPVCGTSCGTCHGPTEVCRVDVGKCEDVCVGKECGTFDGVFCGSCQGPTEVCRQDTGTCEDVCIDRQCGTTEGVFCGACSGATEVCRQDTGICEDVCQWRECGVTEGIDCGTCPGDEICITGQCFAPLCEGGMCQVPAGTFWMGCNEEVDLFCEEDEYPYHEVYLDAFEIDMFEVTQAEYFLCYLDGVCQIPRCNFDPEMHKDQPVVCVFWDQAKTYCDWVGKRLCTEAEWERAARGTDGRRYPWGNDMASCEYAVMFQDGEGCGTGGMWPVGLKPAGASPCGVMDMAGNVREHVNDVYSDDYYQECSSGCSNPQGPPITDLSDHVSKGGSFKSWAREVRISERSDYDVGTEYIGIRCCR
jgi:formylglycine-generating enzyme